MYTGNTSPGTGAIRGQIFTLFMFISFVLIFTFYKNTIKRDKEIKKQREDVLRQQLQKDILHESGIRLKNEQFKREQEHLRQQGILNRMKENHNLCHDMHVFACRPKKPMLGGIRSYVSQSKSGRKRIYLGKEESEEQMKARRGMISGPIAYLFVTVLFYSLVKATTEISQHFRKKAAGEGQKRRCSLQEYASIKHERRNSKAQFTRRSTVLAMSADSNAKQFFNKSFEERQISQVIPEISGQITEPGSPAKKITNGIATKPAPLLRRCSVPAFALGTGGGNKFRRTSMDSFSEDDSSPDVKRRVRMIHRH